MTAALTVKTTVLPGPKIQIDTPGLTTGEAVEVIVVPLPAGHEPRESVLDMIKRMPPGRLFKTAKEVDDYLNRERDSWER